eukprot:scaffold33302_cov129-Isochrysis_galbana.AAC.1
MRAGAGTRPHTAPPIDKSSNWEVRASRAAMVSWQSAWARPLRTARPTLWPCASHVLRPARTPVTGMMGRPARGRAAGLSTPRYVVKISPNSTAESASRREGHAEIHWEEKESVDSQASRRRRRLGRRGRWAGAARAVLVEAPDSIAAEHAVLG